LEVKPAKRLRLARIVDNAVTITVERKARQHADHGRRRHGDEHAEKAEELSPCEQCEDHPHRMKMDAIANQLGIQWRLANVSLGSESVAPCKRVELSRLRWRRRQSLA
jgi:hypothetical protein